MSFISSLNSDVEPKIKHAQVPAADFLCHPVQEPLSGSPGTESAAAVPVLLLSVNWCLCLPHVKLGHL